GATELLQIAERNPPAMERLQRLGRWHLERQVRDPALREMLRPSFTLGCKRLLLSNTYYPALQAENARVVPHAVSRITPAGIVGEDGVEHDVDTIVFGTGFHVSDTSMPTRLVGRGGVTLEQRWLGSPEAYLGTAVHGLPNAF